jgi:hypothetical protein
MAGNLGCQDTRWIPIRITPIMEYFGITLQNQSLAWIQIVALHQDTVLTRVDDTGKGQ